MTTGPKLRLGKTLVPGLLAVGLFGVMALITLNTAFEPMTTAAGAGFPDDISITSQLGYALFDLEVPARLENTEPFLAAVLLVAVALDAALDAALVLAKREDEGEPVSALASAGEERNTAGGPSPAVTDGGTDDSSADTTGQSADTGGDSR